MAIDVPDLLSRSERIDCGEIRRHPFDLWTAQTIELDCGVSIKIADMHQFHTYGPSQILSGLLQFSGTGQSFEPFRSSTYRS